MDPLFLDKMNHEMDKEAAPLARLSENADDWQQEIISELHKQAPYVGEYRTRLIMRELDPQKRYAQGAVEVSSKTAANPRDEKGPPHINKCHIPVVVNGGRLSPLDVFIHNERMWPLNKDRLRRAMFRPQAFEASRRGVGDQSIAASLLPPERGMASGYVKESSPLVPRIVDTLNVHDYAVLEKELADDPQLQARLMKCAGAVGVIGLLAANPPQRSGKDFVKQAVLAIPPTVIQVSKISEGFRVKTANPTSLTPLTQDMDRPTAVETVGQDVVRKVEDGGAVTVSTNAAVKDVMYEASIKQVEEFGQYKVHTKDGRELVGWVFPRVMDLDGTQLPKAVFSNGSESAFQEAVAGALVSKSDNLIDSPPEGLGVFYLARQGSAVALVPVTVEAEMVDPDNAKKFVASTIMGERVELYPTTDIHTVAPIAKGKYAIPNDMGFMPLTGMTKLVESPDGFARQESATKLPKTAQLSWDGSGYNLRGMGVTKLATAMPCDFIDHDQAMFNLVVLGLAPHEAREKLATARHRGALKIIVDPVTTTAERYDQAKLAAAEVLKFMPPKAHLLKLAAEVDDPTSVDHVLSLGFLNPENLDVFLDAVPDLETTLSKLCEMLVAARLGLRVDSASLERGIKNMEAVIQGLKALTRQPRQA